MEFIRLNKEIYLCQMPEEIVQEVEEWKIACDKIKNHKLSFLKAMKILEQQLMHINVVYHIIL